MDQLAKDMIRVGCLQGLKYFSFYIRGREELIATITLPPSPAWIPAPPVSYLVTAYVRCKNPYVYPLPDTEKKSPTEVERPYKLNSTNKWKEHPVRLFVILEELFHLTRMWALERTRLPDPSAESFPSTNMPPPSSQEYEDHFNCFAVDRDFFPADLSSYSAALVEELVPAKLPPRSPTSDTPASLAGHLPPTSRGFANAFRSGALLYFLRDLALNMAQLPDSVMEDIFFLARLHVKYYRESA